MIKAPLGGGMNKHELEFNGKASVANEHLPDRLDLRSQLEEVPASSSCTTSSLGRIRGLTVLNSRGRSFNEDADSKYCTCMPELSTDPGVYKRRLEFNLGSDDEFVGLPMIVNRT